MTTARHHKTDEHLRKLLTKALDNPPTGNDAITLAEAILAHADLTSHQVIGGAELDAYQREAFEAGALSERNRPAARAGVDPSKCTSRSTFPDNVTYRCLRAQGHPKPHQGHGKTWEEET